MEQRWKKMHFMWRGKRLLALFVSVCLLGMMAPVTARAGSVDQDTDGTYLICTTEDLVWFAQYVNQGNYTANAILMADVGFTGGTAIGAATVSTSDWNNGYSVTDVTGYQGTFDGNGYTITMPGNTHLFAAIDGGTVKNLTVTGGSRAIVDYMKSGSILFCTNRSDIKENTNSSDPDKPEQDGHYIGSIVNIVGATQYSGSSDSCSGNTDAASLIQGCTNYGSIDSPWCVGGIVGAAIGSNITIDSCANYGNINLKNGRFLGGIVSNLAKGAKVTNCYDQSQRFNDCGDNNGIYYSCTSDSSISNCFHVNGSNQNGASQVTGLTDEVVALLNQGSNAVVWSSDGIAKYGITLSQTEFTYNGLEQKPELYVVNSLEQKLTEGTDYDIEWPTDCTNAGSKNIIVTFKGSYSGTITKTYSIKKQAQDAPNVSIDTSEETVSTTAGMEYSTDRGNSWMTCQSSMSLSELGWTGSSLQVMFRLVETDNYIAGNARYITIPARPSAPSGLQEENESGDGKKDGKITGLDRSKSYQYKLVTDPDSAWKNVSSSVEITGLTRGRYVVRYAAGNDAFASAGSDSITLYTVLGTPTAKWDSNMPGKATWDKVENASGYSVQLYKNGNEDCNKVGDTINVASDTTEYDFTSAITLVGSYAFKVKAIGDGASYVDSEEVISVSLIRKQAQITVESGKNTYTKIDGDPAFDLEGISHDNTDEGVSLEYTVKDSTNAAGVSVDNDAVVTVDENGKVTIQGVGTATVTVSLPASTHFAAAESVDIKIKVEKRALADDAGSTAGSSGGSAPTGNYVTVTSSDNAADTPAAEPQIKGAGTSKGWSAIVNKIVETIGNQIKDTEMIKEAINIDMQGTSVVPKTVFDTVKGKDIALVFDMGDGISWTVNGKDVTDAAKGISLGVKRDTDVIPDEVINKVTRKQTPIQMSLEHDGEFGFTATLTMKLEPKNKGLYANLYYYNPKAPQGKELEFICADEIDESGNADLVFSHASDYTVVIDYAPMDGSAPTAKTQAENFLAMSKGAKLTWTSDALKVKWGNVNGAEGYDIYATTCGRKFTSQAKVASVTADQTSATIQEVLGSQVSPARGYKVMVKAYRMADGKKQYLGKSMELYTVGNGHKTYTNAGAMTPSVKTLTLTVGKTKKVRATIIKEDPKKKLLAGKYTASKRYFTADETIATVDEKGNVTAHRKGKTTLYIKAANGVTAKVPIIIK